MKQDQQVPRAQMVLWEQRDKLVRPAQRGRLEQLARWAQPETLDQLELLVP